MRTQKNTHLTRVLVAMTAAALLMPVTALAQSSDPLLLLKPHCILPKDRCPTYAIDSLDTVRTERLKEGDILDIDIVISTQKPADAVTIRSWLTYDPTVLEARMIELLPSINAPIPGESVIDAKEGVVKIGGGTSGQLVAGETSIARVTFRVLTVSADTRISFKGYAPAGTGETSVSNQNGAGILSVQPASLMVDLSDAPIVSSSSMNTASVSSSPTVTPPQGATPSNSAFSLLQPQFLRVTTKDKDIFVGWDPLRSSQLVGYNVYYGTVSGLYLQRRSIPSTTSSLVIRDLEPGAQYFVAVRGYDANSLETAFSQEAAIVVGKPETSTSPLSQEMTTPARGDNPLKANNSPSITGETGLSDMILALCFLSALIGTGFALRRQFSLPR